MIFGVDIILLLGIINLSLILFQLLSGLRLIKVKYKTHKLLGIILFFTASIHGIYAIIINYI
ncbi:MAG: hypothetical protein PF485_07160 [Bacteroidales bacterium]|jgi:hypothetical protein|nr:hypothetical protein [Bacteroidales bacterium]